MYTFIWTDGTKCLPAEIVNSVLLYQYLPAAKETAFADVAIIS